MLFFCLVETEACDVPYLEWLAVDNLSEARVHARNALKQHRLPLAAHIFADDERLDTVVPDSPIIERNH